MSGFGFPSNNKYGGGWNTVSTVDDEFGLGDTTQIGSPTAASSSSSELTETLFGYPRQGQSLPVATATTYINVIAPATLPEGYQFDTVINDGVNGSDSQQRTIKVTVPPGGVEKGQSFPIPLSVVSATSTQRQQQVQQQQVQVQQPIHQHPTAAIAARGGIGSTGTISIPVGHWRDSFCGCFNYGLCHPHCWTSLLCPLLAAAQVITRLQLNWRAGPATSQQESRNAFTILFAIALFHLATIAMLYVAIITLDPKDSSQPLPSLEVTVLRLFEIFKYLYFIVVGLWLYKLRMVVRQKYAIPGDPLIDILAGCCCCCHCCTASQLLRHTTDYDTYPSRLMTTSGLPPTVPSIV